MVSKASPFFPDTETMAVLVQIGFAAIYGCGLSQFRHVLLFTCCVLLFYVYLIWQMPLFRATYSDAWTSLSINIS